MSEQSDGGLNDMIKMQLALTLGQQQLALIEAGCRVEILQQDSAKLNELQPKFKEMEKQLEELTSKLTRLMTPAPAEVPPADNPGLVDPMPRGMLDCAREMIARGVAPAEVPVGTPSDLDLTPVRDPADDIA